MSIKMTRETSFENGLIVLHTLNHWISFRKMANVALTETTYTVVWKSFLWPLVLFCWFLKSRERFSLVQILAQCILVLNKFYYPSSEKFPTKTN